MKRAISLEVEINQTEKLMDKMKRSTARQYIELLSAHLHMDKPRLIEVGCGGGDFLVAAKKNGYSVVGSGD